jgi:cysteine desulfurase/selenocysteine lyase
VTVEEQALAPVLDVDRVRADFPILGREVHGRRLVYLDSAATSQKPRQVLDAERGYYERHNAAVHRGAHLLAQEATAAFEAARARVARFIGAADPGEVVFTKNATESINLVAYACSNATAGTGAGQFVLRPGDEILVTELEHHANLVPWQELCRRTGAVLRWVPVDGEGRLALDLLDRLVTERTRLVAFSHQSNVLGTALPVERFVSAARAVGSLVVLDACQSVPHRPVDVQALGVDFVAFSGHKMLGPSGVGVLWGRAELLADMPPFITGGSMIETVTMERTTFAAPPQRFEAGVPNVAQAVGLAAACDYLDALTAAHAGPDDGSTSGMAAVAAHEHALARAGLALFADLPGVRLLGPTDPAERGATFAFTVDGIHPHDLSQVLDEHGIAIRVGHHCAWPLHRALGIGSSARASGYVTTGVDDLAALVEGIRLAQRFFGVA